MSELSLFYAVVDNIRVAYETKKDHADARQMGSGLIEISDAGSQSKFIIKMGSKSQQLIEATLIKIKESG